MYISFILRYTVQVVDVIVDVVVVFIVVARLFLFNNKF